MVLNKNFNDLCKKLGKNHRDDKDFNKNNHDAKRFIIKLMIGFLLIMFGWLILFRMIGNNYDKLLTSKNILCLLIIMVILYVSSAETSTIIFRNKYRK